MPWFSGGSHEAHQKLFDFGQLEVHLLKESGADVFLFSRQPEHRRKLGQPRRCFLRCHPPPARHFLSYRDSFQQVDESILDLKAKAILLGLRVVFEGRVHLEKQGFRLRVQDQAIFLQCGPQLLGSGSGPLRCAKSVVRD